MYDEHNGDHFLLLVWCPPHSQGWLTFSSPPGVTAAQPHWTSMSFRHFSSSLWTRPPPPLATPCRSAPSASWPHTCQNADLVDFVPVVAETLGSLSDEAIHIVRAFGKAIAQRANLLDFSTSTHHLFHCLAISPWLGNACLWLHCLPSLLPSVDGVI